MAMSNPIQLAKFETTIGHQKFDLQQHCADLTRNLFHEEAFRQVSRIEHPQPDMLRNSINSGGRVFELTHLEHNTGKHRTPDAMVFVPNGFDAR
ncbi:MAG: hypothetical protein C0469_03130, partial [Cyanobacteria bacterium DS2.3.42]|nr:hypothetical protein [Cyanobacteria bacterium DS2.3.42]